MWLISKWHIPPYIKGVIIYNTLNKSRENPKNKKIIIIAKMSQKMTIHYL